jgi:transcriptional regulator with GAF, ATPase, and Fis domain
MSYGKYLWCAIFHLPFKWQIGHNRIKENKGGLMGMDENDFFREATKRICGTLDIDQALWQLLLYIRDFMPAEAMFLNVYDLEPGVMETIAMADYKGGQKTSIKTTLPFASRSALSMKESLISQTEIEPYFRITEHIRDSIIFKPLSEVIGMPDAPAILIQRRLKGQSIGSLIVTNHSGLKYSEENARLLGLLNDPSAIAISNYMRLREVLRLKDLLTEDNQFLHEELRGQIGEEVAGADFGLKGVMDLVRSVAPSSTPVLLLGETGVGKEVIANVVHKWSLRKEGPLVKVNCGAIPEGLIDSELFGHEKGAFTGAHAMKRGRFERAHGGTIFLDEIGDLPIEAQSRLLRVLQEKEIERVGGTKPIKVDVRVVAATNRNLEDMLASREFRQDLYFRLRVFPIVIPPLRDRLFDIPALVEHFIRKNEIELKLRYHPTLARGAMERLMNYHWPGNVRELQNVLERALILSKEQPLTFEDLMVDIRSSIPSSSVPDNLGDCSISLNSVISSHISRTLQMTDGRVGGEKGAVRLLEINPSTLRKKMRKLGIPFGRKAKKN